MEDRGDLSQAAAFWDGITAENFQDGINMSRAKWQLHPGAVAHRRRLLWDTQPGRDFADLLLTLDTMLGASGALPPYFSLIRARRNS